MYIYELFFKDIHQTTAGINMSKTCEVCGKHPMTGRTLSHAHNVNPRLFMPNLRTIKTKVNGATQKTKICMKCLKAMAKR
jgi:large subunit ribosomal protein L28